ELGKKAGNTRALVLAEALDAANGMILEQDRSPSRKLGGIDNRGSHFYLALYWAQALASQTKDAALAARFRPVADALVKNEKKIVDELLAVQGRPVDLGGYYHPDARKVSAAMRPSETFNAVIDSI